MQNNKVTIQQGNHAAIKGFTLVEMVITMGIFTMMTLIYTANFKGFQEGLTLESDADAISSAIRQIEIWALTGELIEGVRPDGGYGFTITAPCTTATCAFTIYGNTCNPDNHLYDSGCDVVVKTTNLNSLVSVSVVTPASPLDIVFTFPTAASYVNGTAAVDGAVTLSHRADPSRLKTISVDGVSGQITIQ